MKTKFLIADEIRQEASGKQTVLGLFADDVVVAQIPSNGVEIPEGVPRVIERLAFLVNVSGLPVGTHKISGQLFDPSGKAYGDALPLEEITTEVGKSHSIILEMKPFILKGDGFYNLAIWIDDEERKHLFEVRTINMDS